MKFIRNMWKISDNSNLQVPSQSDIQVPRKSFLNDTEAQNSTCLETHQISGKYDFNNLVISRASVEKWNFNKK